MLRAILHAIGKMIVNNQSMTKGKDKELKKEDRVIQNKKILNLLERIL